MHCQWLLYDTTTESSSCNRDFMTCKAKNIYYLDLHSKNVPTLALKEQSGLHKYLISYLTSLENKRLIKEINSSDNKILFQYYLFLFIDGT